LRRRQTALRDMRMLRRVPLRAVPLLLVVLVLRVRGVRGCVRLRRLGVRLRLRAPPGARPLALLLNALDRQTHRCALQRRLRDRRERMGEAAERV